MTDTEAIKLIAKAEALEAQARLMLGYANNYRAEAEKLMNNLPNKKSDKNACERL